MTRAALLRRLQSVARAEEREFADGQCRICFAFDGEPCLPECDADELSDDEVSALAMLVPPA